VAAATTVVWPSTARFDALRVPAEVIAPVPVVLMVDDVAMLFAVLMVPNPLAMEPDARAPVPVTSDGFPVVITVPVLPVNECGSVIVVVAEGLPTANIVRFVSTVDPSNCKAFVPRTDAVIVTESVNASPNVTAPPIVPPWMLFPLI